MKQPQAAVALGAVAPPPGAHQPVASKRGGDGVASTDILREPDDHQQEPTAGFIQGTRTLDDLVRQIIAARTAGGAAAYARGNTPDALAVRAQRLRNQHDYSAGQATQREDDPHQHRGPQI